MILATGSLARSTTLRAEQDLWQDPRENQDAKRNETDMGDRSTLNLREQISLACLAEVVASKPGNVHRGADFEEMTFGDFAVSSIVIAEGIATAAEGVGQAVLAAVSRTHQFVGQNTNLGIALLLAPLAAIPPEEGTQQGIQRVLAGLTAEDATHVYKAIRVASAGHLGSPEKWDVHQEEPPDDLLLAMQAAADRDNIAKQYVTDFHDVFTIADWICDGEQPALDERIVRAHVKAMATWPDSLIARKCGAENAGTATHYARRAVECEVDADQYWQAVAELDFWLRSDGQQRNPGTTADLVCAATFVTLREGRIQPPYFG
jgi:triphosphoribosyl-dephospho-CoA synthase